MTAVDQSADPPGAAIRWGFKLPNCGGVLCKPEWAVPTTIDELARAAHGAGFDSLWLHDHLVRPSELAELDAPSFFEPIVTATRLATMLPEAVIGIATVILPFREPAVLAKQMATLGAFFPGRIVVGVGIGRYASEFMAVGMGPYQARGRISDEYLEVIRALLEQHSVTHRGDQRSLDDAVMYPKPAPRDMSLWVAGNSPVGARRAARFGDGWIAAAIGPDELNRLMESMPAVERPFVAALSATIRRAESVGTGADGGAVHTHANAMEGDAASVAARLNEYVALGVSHFILSLGAVSLEQVHEDIDWFTTSVVPMVRST